MMLRAFGYITPRGHYSILGSGQSRYCEVIFLLRHLGVERLGHLHTATLAPDIGEKGRGEGHGL